MCIRDRFRLPVPNPGDPLSAFSVTLDNNAGLVDHAGIMLDTLWTTREMREIDVPQAEEPKEGDPQPDDIIVSATIPLMRVTNHICVSFYHEEFPMTTDHGNYEVWVESKKGRDVFDIFGAYSANASKLRYNPYNSWTAGDSKGHLCGYREFGVPRIMLEDSRSDRTMLCFRNKSTGNVTEIDLAYVLGQFNAAYAQHGWSVQEFLDREYDFDLQVVLDDDSWKFINLSINILSWSKRIQNENL